MSVGIGNFAREYNHNNARLTMGGYYPESMQAIGWNPMQDKALLHGQGIEPQDIGRGKRRYDGSVTIRMSDYIALIKLANNQNLLNVRIDLFIALIPNIEDVSGGNFAPSQS